MVNLKESGQPPLFSKLPNLHVLMFKIPRFSVMTLILTGRPKQGKRDLSKWERRRTMLRIH